MTWALPDIETLEQAEVMCDEMSERKLGVPGDAARFVTLRACIEDTYSVIADQVMNESNK